jgi:hypothetical protein
LASDLVGQQVGESVVSGCERRSHGSPRDAHGDGALRLRKVSDVAEYDDEGADGRQ